MNSYIVTIRTRVGEDRVFTLLLKKEDLANLLLNVDEDAYEIGDIISTYSEKQDGILRFCRVYDNLETGK